MFALAAFGPIGIAAAVVGTVATAVYASSSSSSFTASSSNKDAKTSEAKREAIKDKNEKILNEIDIYKNKEKSRIKKKYNADIEIADNFIFPHKAAGSIVSSALNMSYMATLNNSNKKIKVGILKSSAEDLSNAIATLEKETQEMINLVEELEEMKSATFS